MRVSAEKAQQRRKARLQRDTTERWHTAQNFGPHGKWLEPWHFMPSHLRFDLLAEEAASFSVEAEGVAAKMPEGVAAAQLDLDIWLDTFAVRLPAGVTLPTHGHSHAGALYVVSGALKVINFGSPKGDPDSPVIGDRGVQEIGAGEAALFGLHSRHRIEVLEPTIIVQTVSPRLTGYGCHDHVPNLEQRDAKLSALVSLASSYPSPHWTNDRIESRTTRHRAHASSPRRVRVATEAKEPDQPVSRS